MFDDFIEAFKDDPKTIIGAILAGLGILTIATIIVSVLFMLHWIIGVIGIAVAFIIIGGHLINS